MLRVLHLISLKKLCAIKVKLTAMAIAICASVTVSMGLEMRGAFSVIFFVSADVRSCGKGTLRIILRLV